MPTCHKCSSSSVDLKQRGFMENIYRCRNCRHEFTGEGTGVKTLRITATIIGVVAAGDSMAHNHHWDNWNK